MDIEEEVLNLYVDLDSLFDTRLTILSLAHPGIAEDMCRKGTFVDRTRDEFGHCSERVFRQMYAQRTSEVLHHSKPTKIVHLLGEYVDNVITSSQHLGHNAAITVFVNTFPYELTDEEVTTLMKVLLVYMPEVDDINISHQEDISPQWLVSNVAMSIMYDGLKWFNENLANGRLLSYPMSDSILVVPKLIPRSHGKVGEEIFTSIEKESQILVKIKFLQSTDFSYGLNVKGDLGHKGREDSIEPDLDVMDERIDSSNYSPNYDKSTNETYQHITKK